jgi:ribosomal protein L37AE/L43A
MRVEVSLPGETLRQLTCSDGPTRAVVARYYRTGEEAPVGAYSCTFCGRAVVVRSDSSLPLCPNCDSTEFVSASSVENEPTLAGSS